MLKIITTTIEIEGKNYDVIDFDEIDKEKHHGFVYVTVNKINNKKYVGQHSLWNKNYLGSGVYLNRAINKYGIENFERYIVDLAESQEELDEKETFYVNEEWGNIVKSQDWYNIKDGAQHGGNCFAGRTEEEMKKTRKKMSESGKKLWLDPEHRKKMSEANKNRWLNPEFRKKFSKARKKQWLDPEYRKKISEVRKKQWLDPEYRKKISEVRKGRTHTEETRKKMSESRKNLWLDLEHRKKMSEANKNRWLNPEFRKKFSKAVVIFKNNEYLDTFDSITDTAQALEETIGGSLGGLKNGISHMVNKGWIPKRERLKGYSAMFKKDYDKLQERSD